MREVSPTMVRLLGLLNEARSRRVDSEQTYREALDEEVGAKRAFDLAYSKSLLASEQSTDKLRVAEAVVLTDEQSLRHRLAVALRRSARVALDGSHDDAETLQAAFHAYNRELKCELELAGAA